MAEGKRAEAQAMLDAVLREAEALRAELARSAAGPARRTLQRAEAALRAGQIQEAINLAHQAYDEDKLDPDVFEGMMRIHADAGRSLDRPEEYESAVRLLECAHHHDRTDRSIHRALADRHYQHAIVLRSRGDVAGARKIIRERALFFEPSHPGANQLLQELPE
jgi:hypothetical protein